MDARITRIVQDIETAKGEGVCSDCLADVLLSALDHVLDTLPDRDNARMIAAATLDTQHATAH